MLLGEEVVVLSSLVFTRARLLLELSAITLLSHRWLGLLLRLLYDALEGWSLVQIQKRITGRHDDSVRVATREEQERVGVTLIEWDG